MNDISHFAIRADDLDRAQSFYSNVFGWKFEAWGPPNFFLIHTSENENALLGAIHQRETPISGDGICAFECTISVKDVDAIAEAVVRNGGAMIYQKAVIHGVGEIIRFKDTEQNFVSAMRYDPSA